MSNQTTQEPITFDELEIGDKFKLCWNKMNNYIPTNEWSISLMINEKTDHNHYRRIGQKKQYVTHPLQNVIKIDK